MDSKEIRELLDKYWACETSLAEEEKLKAYFNQNEVAPDLAEYKSMFQYFGQQVNITMKGEFSQQLSQKIARHRPQKPKSRLLLNMMRVAASLLIILSCSYFYYNHYQNQQIATALLEDTYQDPEIAYQEMKKALLQVSKRMNSGTKYMVSIKQINEGTKYFKTDQKEPR